MFHNVYPRMAPIFYWIKKEQVSPLTAKLPTVTFMVDIWQWDKGAEDTVGVYLISQVTGEGSAAAALTMLNV